jgi:vacuolar-type H+-ATPase subunit E/Vma4
MALSDLLRTLEREATARIEEIRRRAQEEAVRVRAEADAERERRRLAILSAKETVLRKAAARELEAARRATLTRRLEARGTVLARIRARVAQRLDARADDVALFPLVRSDLLRALEYAGNGDVVITTSRGMVYAVQHALEGRAGVRVEATSSGGGVIVRAIDGAWAVDGTFRSRLDRAWPRLAIALVRRLETRA